jgi:hypothetical protein
MISWYTIYIKNSPFDDSLTNCFIRNGISVVRAYQKAENLVIEIFAPSNQHAIESLIKHSVLSVPQYQNASANSIVVYEGVELTAIFDTIYYTGDHIEKEVLQYFSPDCQGKDNQTIGIKNSYYPQVILDAAVFTIILAIFVYGLMKLSVFQILLGVIALLILRQKYVNTFAFQMEVNDQTVSYTTIFGKKVIPISNICQLDIQMKRGYWATIEHIGGQFCFPFRGIVPPNNEQQFLAAIIAGTGLSLTSGRSRMSCTFRPIRPYMGE